MLADGPEAIANNWINYQKLVAFAVVSCPGTLESKATVFFNDIFGKDIDKHDSIASNSKSLLKFFNTVVKLFSIEFMDFCEHYGQKKNLFKDEDEVLQEAMQDLYEDLFLNEVFGSRSILKISDWVTQLQADPKWIFDSEEIRKKLASTSGKADTYKPERHVL